LPAAEPLRPSSHEPAVQAPGPGPDHQRTPPGNRV